MDHPDWIPRPLDILVGYDRTRGEIRGQHQWHPEDARGNFAATETDYFKQRRARREGKKWQRIINIEKRAKVSRKKHGYARREVRRMIRLGYIDMTNFDDTDAGRAEEALTACVSVLRNTDSDKIKLAAAKTLLEFVKTKPTQRVENTIKTAEAWLDEIAK